MPREKGAKEREKVETKTNKWWTELYKPFVDLVHAPRALWGINVSYYLEGILYFGMTLLLTPYFTSMVGLDEKWSGWMAGFLVAGVTLSQLFLGGVADKIGVRKAILVALGVLVVGRNIVGLAGEVFPINHGLGSNLHLTVLLGMVFIIVGYGMYQPAAYTGIKKYCDEKTAAVGYGMLYALMNAGAASAGLISPAIRNNYGINSVYTFYGLLTVVGLIAFAALLTYKVEEQAILSVKLQEKEDKGAEAKGLFSFKMWLKNHPLANARFSFFIFAVVPVQTIFAHFYYTFPLYIMRALGEVGEKYMEVLGNTINPVLIFVLTPAIAAWTRKVNIYKMMMIGTTVMALPLFLLTAGPNLALLVLAIVLMSIGEAMWQPRFLQYAAEIAPEGKTGAYMGVAQFPWFLTKIIVSAYAGLFLMKYCPKDVTAQDTETMWLIHSIVAIASPILLFLARNWVRRGEQEKTRPPSSF